MQTMAHRPKRTINSALTVAHRQWRLPVFHRQCAIVCAPLSVCHCLHNLVIVLLSLCHYWHRHPELGYRASCSRVVHNPKSHKKCMPGTPNPRKCLYSAQGQIPHPGTNARAQDPGANKAPRGPEPNKKPRDKCRANSSYWCIRQDEGMFPVSPKTWKMGGLGL